MFPLTRSGTPWPPPALPAPVDRSVERVVARAGILELAEPRFAPAALARHAGLFLAFPALEASGLLECAKEVHGASPNGFYGLETMLIEAVLRAPAGETRAQGATRFDPEDWYKSLHDAVIAESILNRIISTSELIQLDGPHMRQHTHAQQEGGAT